MSAMCPCAARRSWTSADVSEGDEGQRCGADRARLSPDAVAPQCSVVRRSSDAVGAGCRGARQALRLLRRRPRRAERLHQVCGRRRPRRGRSARGARRVEYASRCRTAGGAASVDHARRLRMLSPACAAMATHARASRRDTSACRMPRRRGRLRSQPPRPSPGVWTAARGGAHRARWRDASITSLFRGGVVRNRASGRRCRSYHEDVRARSSRARVRRARSAPSHGARAGARAADRGPALAAVARCAGAVPLRPLLCSARRRQLRNSRRRATGRRRPAIDPGTIVPALSPPPGVDAAAPMRSLNSVRPGDDAPAPGAARAASRITVTAAQAATQGRPRSPSRVAHRSPVAHDAGCSLGTYLCGRVAARWRPRVKLGPRRPASSRLDVMRDHARRQTPTSSRGSQARRSSPAASFARRASWTIRRREVGPRATGRSRSAERRPSAAQLTPPRRRVGFLRPFGWATCHRALDRRRSWRALRAVAAPSERLLSPSPTAGRTATTVRHAEHTPRGGDVCGRVSAVRAYASSTLPSTTDLEPRRMSSATTAVAQAAEAARRFARGGARARWWCTTLRRHVSAAASVLGARARLARAAGHRSGVDGVGRAAGESSSRRRRALARGRRTTSTSARPGVVGEARLRCGDGRDRHSTMTANRARARRDSALGARPRPSRATYRRGSSRRRLRQARAGCGRPTTSVRRARSTRRRRAACHRPPTRTADGGFALVEVRAARRGLAIGGRRSPAARSVGDVGLLLARRAAGRARPRDRIAANTGGERRARRPMRLARTAEAISSARVVFRRAFARRARATASSSCTAHARSGTQARCSARAANERRRADRRAASCRSSTFACTATRSSPTPRDALGDGGAPSPARRAVDPRRAATQICVAADRASAAGALGAFSLVPARRARVDGRRAGSPARAARRFDRASPTAARVVADGGRDGAAARRGAARRTASCFGQMRTDAPRARHPPQLAAARRRDAPSREHARARDGASDGRSRRWAPPRGGRWRPCSAHGGRPPTSPSRSSRRAAGLVDLVADRARHERGRRGLRAPARCRRLESRIRPRAGALAGSRRRRPADARAD